MQTPENPVAEQGLAAAVVELLATNEDALIVAPYNPMYELAVWSGYCKWGLLDEEIFRSTWVLPFPKGSPYLQVFSEM